MKRLFQQIRLRLHIPSLTINLQIDKQEQVLKKRVIIHQELPGSRTGHWKSFQEDHYPGHPDESLQPRLTHSQGPSLMEPHRDPKGWGGAISNGASNCFQDVKPGDFEASD